MSTRWLTAAVVFVVGTAGGCRVYPGTVSVPADQPLPNPTTWMPYCDGWRSPLPPKLREAHRVAANYRQLPLEEVYFGGVSHDDWGELYEFDRRGARGFRQFHLRGLAKVADEWRLICTAHNLLKLAQAR